MVNVIEIAKEVGAEYGVSWPRLEAGRFKPEQIKILTEMYHSLDFSKPENVRAYLEQKAKFLTGNK